MKLNAKYITHKLKDDKVIIGFECDTNFLNSIAFLKEGQEYQLELLKQKGSKSVSQNSLFWTIVREICMAQENSLKDMNDIYFNILEFSGTKTYEITILKEAYEDFKKNIRHCKIIDDFTKNGNEYYIIQCFPGLSTFDSRETSKIIDYAFEYASRIGLDLEYLRSQV